MRTVETRRGSAATKRTPPARKAAAKTPPTPLESVTSKTMGTRSGSASKAKQAKTSETTPPQVKTSSDSKLEQSPVEEVKALADASMVTPVKKKVVSGTRSVAKKRPGKPTTPASEKAVFVQTPKSQEAVNITVEESATEEVECVKKEEPAVEITKQELSSIEVEEPIANSVAECTKEEQTAAEDGEKSVKEEHTAAEDNEESVKEEETSMEVDPTEIVGDYVKQKESVAVKVAESSENKEPSYQKMLEEGDFVKQLDPLLVEVVNSNENKEPILQKKGEQGDFVKQKEPVLMEVAKFSDKKEPSFQKKGEKADQDPEEEETENLDHKEEPNIESFDNEVSMKDELQGEDARPELDEYGGYEGFEEYGDRVDYGDHEEEELAEDDIEDPVEETEAFEDEHRELKAIAKDHMIKKEHEIFVGGLDRGATEDDVKKVFERIGEIAEVRLHKSFSNNKNKGYAFVKFVNKEHAKRALSEMKNPVICGKRCGTAPSEDNTILFVGNICNTWTMEAVKQKLKDYNVEGVENITLVPDVQHDGLSRGFAFVEFYCHADAMAAYKRLQKPDAVFGHPERTVKVAFAEPLREPDPEIMAQVKTVFLDGVPLHWNEDRVREQMKGYGDIVRIVLSRNMSTAKRKDYGFVDFTTHEAAVASISGINNTKLVDGNSNSKTKLKARLSNPLPKTQAVKGGMCGGFRISHGGSGTFSRFGRGFGWGGHHFNRENFQRSRGYQRGRNQINRTGPIKYGFGNRYTEFHGRQSFERGERRGSFRGGHHAAGRAMVAAGPSRPNPNRPWHDGPDRRHGEHIPYRRQPISPNDNVNRSFNGRQVDDPYFYDNRAHGVKRPFYMVDHDPDYMMPSRIRPRQDYDDPAVPFHGTSYHENYGAGSDVYYDDYYGSEYGAHPPYYGDDHSYGAGYYY